MPLSSVICSHWEEEHFDCGTALSKPHCGLHSGRKEWAGSHAKAPLGSNGSVWWLLAKETMATDYDYWFPWVLLRKCVSQWEPNKSVPFLMTSMTQSHVHMALLMSLHCAPRISQFIADMHLLCCLYFPVYFLFRYASHISHGHINILWSFWLTKLLSATASTSTSKMAFPPAC